jgi:hypothetical protein
MQCRSEKSTAYQHQPVQAVWVITSLVSISEQKHISISISISVASTWHKTHSVRCNKHHSDTVQTRKVHSVSMWASTGYVSNNIISEYKYISISISLTSTWCRHTQCDATSISLIQKVSEKSTMHQHESVETMWAKTSLVSTIIHKSGIYMMQTHSVWCNRHHSDTIQFRKSNRVSTSAGTGDVSNDIISEHKYISISISVASTWYSHTKLDATSIILIQYRPGKSTAYQHEPVQAMWAITSLVSICTYLSA